MILKALPIIYYEVYLTVIIEYNSIAMVCGLDIIYYFNNFRFVVSNDFNIRTQ